MLKENDNFMDKMIFDYIDSSDNDIFSRMSDCDLQELFDLIDSYYLEYRNKLGFDAGVTFGTELEFEYSKYNKIKEEVKKVLFGCSWNVDIDVTLIMTDGGEVISPVLRDNVVSWENLKKVCEIISNYASIGERSGGHIHVGTHVLGNKVQSWLNFIKLWSVYENIIFRFTYGEYLIARPVMYEFAEPIRDDLWKCYKKFSKSNEVSVWDIIEKINRGGDSQAINLEKVNSLDECHFENTIEFRCPNGTLEPVIWQNNINFFVKLLEYAKSSNFDDDLVQKRYIQNKGISTSLYLYNRIYIQQALELCDMVFTNNFDKVYFLRQYFKSFEVGDFDYIKAKRFIRR